MRPAKVHALLLCEDFIRTDDSFTVVKPWQRQKCETFPADVKLVIVAMFSGDFIPKSMSITILDADTQQQITRKVDQAPGFTKPMAIFSVKTPPISFPAAGWYAVKIDAEGISPFACEFELAQAGT